MLCLLTLALAAAALAVPAPFEERCTLKTTGQYTPCRAGPGENYKIVQELPPGESGEYSCYTTSTSAGVVTEWDLLVAFHCYVEASIVACPSKLPKCAK